LIAEDTREQISSVTQAFRAYPASLFAILDEHSQLAAHMGKPSLMMAGATMEVEMDVGMESPVYRQHTEPTTQYRRRHMTNS